MRKNFCVVIIMLLLVNTAWASKARMLALGQDGDTGSSYIMDTRSAFGNPASLNLLNNYITTEWGKSTPDTDKPNAEGGFFRYDGNFTYGVYLGSDIDANLDQKTNLNGTDTTDDFMSPDNRFDVFFAGDAGTQWGIRAYYADGKNEQGSFNKNYSSMGLGIGLIMDDIEVFSNFIFKDEATGAYLASDKWESDLGINVGASYYWNGTTLFAEYTKTAYDKIANDLKTENSYEKYVVGSGWVYEYDENSKAFFDIQIEFERDHFKGATDTKTTTRGAPFTIAFETKATSWLDLRGSVKQTLFGTDKNKDGKTKSASDSTTVAAGATVKFGKLRIDGLIGTTPLARNTTTTPQDNEGSLATDNLMTRVSLNYWF